MPPTLIYPSILLLFEVESPVTTEPSDVTLVAPMPPMTSKSYLAVIMPTPILLCWSSA